LSLLPPALLSAALLPLGTQRGFAGDVAGGVAGGVASAIVVTLSAPADDEASADAEHRQAVMPRPTPMAEAAPAAEAASGPAYDDETGATADEGAAYLPAAQLTERPQLLQDIAPDWRAQDRLPQRMVCTLLVSEYGDVDRVLCDEPVVSPATLQAVGERFRAARFAPGRLYGRPVRSALRIELRLD
jgi:hypothetical protein